jgi:hypothetical protein
MLRAQILFPILRGGLQENMASKSGFDRSLSKRRRAGRVRGCGGAGGGVGGGGHMGGRYA